VYHIVTDRMTASSQLSREGATGNLDKFAKIQAI
jgi:hypothetical protein